MRALSCIGAIITVAILVIMLAGCAHGIVPRSLLECADQPRSPADDAGAGQKEVSLYIVDLAASGQDCRSNLGSVRRILYPEN